MTDTPPASAAGTPMTPLKRAVYGMDDRIYLLLTMPQMCVGNSVQTQVALVMELLQFRAVLTASAPPDWEPLYRKLGLLKGNTFVFPETFEPPFLETFKALAKAAGWDPGERAANRAHWAYHWDNCPQCHTSDPAKQGACEAGREIWNRTPMSGVYPDEETGNDC